MSVTSIPIFLSEARSVLGIPRSVINWCTAESGAIEDKLRRPNLLESQTATTIRATSIMHD